MANFFANPEVPYSPNPEPAGFDVIRAMIMSGLVQNNANPWGLTPSWNGSMAGNPMLPSAGRGTFDPYTGGYSNVPWQGQESTPWGASMGSGGDWASSPGSYIPQTNPGSRGPRQIPTAGPSPSSPMPSGPILRGGGGGGVGRGLVPQAFDGGIIPGHQYGIPGGGSYTGGGNFNPGSLWNASGSPAAPPAGTPAQAAPRSPIDIGSRPQYVSWTPGMGTNTPTQTPTNPTPPTQPNPNPVSDPISSPTGQYGFRASAKPDWWNPDGEKLYDGRVPYPGEYAPMPDGNMMPKGPGISHIRAPMSTPRPGAAPRGIMGGMPPQIGALVGAARRGQLQAFHTGRPGTAFDAAPANPNQARMPLTTTSGGSAAPPNTQNPVSPVSGTPTGYPTGAQNLGGPMSPWLMPYSGNFTAPMSPYENQALTGMSGYVGSGMGLGNANNYLNNELSGAYIGSGNPYMTQIQNAQQTLKDNQDQQYLRQLGSSFAAGGNALSGARIGAQQQYQNLSNANFNNQMGQMRLQDLMQERGLQQGAVPMAGNLAQTQMQGYGNLMQAGALPRQLQQNDYTAQYGDWLRQIGAMQNQNQYQNNLNLALLHAGYPGSHQPGYAPSAASGVAGGIGALLPLLQQLFGGGSKSGGGSGGGMSGGGGGGNPGGGGGGNNQGGGQGGGGDIPDMSSGDQAFLQNGFGGGDPTSTADDWASLFGGSDPSMWTSDPWGDTSGDTGGGDWGGGDSGSWDFGG